MTRSLLCLCLCFSVACACAQTLSGRVTDEATGEVLPYASIYLQQNGTGATTNAEGRYELRLKTGTNTLVFQYLGYQTQVIEVSSGRGTMDVQLRAEALDLKEVEVLSGGEDVSYSVIRRAIAKADYHRNQVDGFTADAYLKGKGKVDKIPQLFQKLVPKEDREDVTEIIGKSFTSETTSKINYTRPNTWKEEVISRYVVGEENFEVNGYINSSFYDPEVYNVVSPLSPKSFAYYKFEHEGVFVDQDKLINKIRVIPRSPGEDVFEGYVYIVQDDWSLHSLDLRTYRTGFVIDVRVNYNEVEEHIWMPTTMTIDGSGGLLGVKLSVSYISNTSNYQIDLNPELQGYVEVIDEKTQPDVAAVTRKENKTSGYEQKLQNGGELTRRELMKLMKSYEKEEQEATDDPKVVANYSFSDDSVKTIRDAAAWEAVRPIPLTADEIAGYRYADSIAIVNKQDSIAEARGDDGDTKTGKNGKQRKRLPRWLRFDVAPEAQFNPVEGYAIGGKLTKSIRKTVSDPGDTTTHQQKLGELSVRSRYGFAWQRASWEVGYENWVSNDSVGQYFVRGGRYLQQFDATPAIDPILNSFTALIWGDSYTRLYERAYVTAGYRKRFSDAFKLSGEISYEDRRTVTNQTDHRWGGPDEFAYAPNAPFNEELGVVDQLGNAAIIDVTAALRPGLTYRIRNGRRHVIDESAPTLALRVKSGIPNIGESVSEFTLLEGSYRHQFAAGRKGNINLLVRGGAFLNNQRVDFPDFKHFATSEIILTRLDPIGSYRLLPYYRNSTGEEYAEVYAHYQFRKLLLTNIQKLHLMGLKEDLFVNYLYTPTSEHYTELGYSLDNILRVLRLEFVTSFRDGGYDDFGVRLSFTTTFGAGSNGGDNELTKF